MFGEVEVKIILEVQLAVIESIKDMVVGYVVVCKGDLRDVGNVVEVWYDEVFFFCYVRKILFVEIVVAQGQVAIKILR